MGEWGIVDAAGVPACIGKAAFDDPDSVPVVSALAMAGGTKEPPSNAPVALEWLM